METSSLESRIQSQIQWIESELRRSKIEINNLGFDCTTAPYVLVSNYRRALKEQLKILKMNLD